MRQIGTIQEETAAKDFGDYLLTLQIANQVDASARGGWNVWVVRDENLERATAELDAFQKNPNDARFRSAGRAADAVREGLARAEQRRTEQFIDVRTRWNSAMRHVPIVTIVLIVISLVVGVLTHLGNKMDPVGNLLLFATDTPEQFQQRVEKLLSEGGWLERLRQSNEKAYDWLIEFLANRNMDQILHGQVWRLVTPMFLHFGFLHLLFNMFWLRDLGSMIESRRGSIVMLLLVFGSELVAGFAQFLWDGPNSGGMSGVVYALFGYVWIKGRIQPYLGMGLNQQTVSIMLIWLVACMTGLLGPIANAAHVGGLVFGCLAAGLPFWWMKMKRKMQARV